MKRLARLGFVVSVVASFGLESAPVATRDEAVATDSPVATQVALDILEAGGTAADAAAAAMLALGVASPGSSGFGGGGFAVYHRASDGQTVFLDFRERAPMAATPDMFVRAESARPGSRPSQVGGLAVGVPGEPMGIATLVSRFGRLPLRAVVAPAVGLARRGVTPTPYVASMVTGRYAQGIREDSNMRRWFTRTGAVRALAQPALAAVLADFGRRGPDALYRGRRAARLAADVQRAGGILTTADLAAYSVVERVPLRERHFGFEWVTAPPPSAGGATMLASLDFLERAGIGPRSDDAALAHALLESWKGPFLDRQAAFGDPDHVDVPVATLASEERRRARAALFDATRARAAEQYALPIPGAGDARTPDGGGTTHFCIVDREGNVASVTTTVNLGFGAKFTAAGVIMNDQMDDFARAIGATNAFGLVGGGRNLPGPGRRPVSSMTPTIAFDASGRARLCVGGAGGSRIPTATMQAALRVVLRGDGAQAAVAAPRLHHQAEPDVARSESAVPSSPALLDALRARGHQLDLVEHVAVVQLIWRGPNGVLEAGADPRKGGLGVAR